MFDRQGQRRPALDRRRIVDGLAACQADEVLEVRALGVLLVHEDEVFAETAADGVQLPVVGQDGAFAANASIARSATILCDLSDDSGNIDAPFRLMRLTYRVTGTMGSRIMVARGGAF
jgi:hypothetical protein